MNIYRLIQTAILIFLVFQISAQSTKIVPSNTDKAIATKLGVVKITKDMPRSMGVKDKKRAMARRDFKKPRNFEGRFPRKVTQPEKHIAGPDRVRQTQVLSRKNTPVQILVNQDGLFAGGSPADPSGDVGIEHYMQAVNITDIAILKKDGTLVTDFRARDLWQQLDSPRNSGGDPIILFDQEAKRWIITEFPSTQSEMLIAISDTADPFSPYAVYAVRAQRFPDYPKYGLWNNAITVTTNEEGPDRLTCYFINRDDLLSGADELRYFRSGIEGTTGSEQGFIVSTPIDWSGSNPPPADRGPIILSLNDASWNSTNTEDVIEIHSFEIDWDAASDNIVASKTSVPVSPYDSNPCSVSGFRFECIPQKNGGGLDGLPEFITYQPHYRNFGTHESMVFSFITDVTDGDNIAGIRWIEMRRTITEDWSLYQEGTFALDDNLNRFLSSVAMDGKGNIALVYNTSGVDDYASIRMTGRYANDPLGTMTVPETIIAEGENAINSMSRFGDYGHMTIDPIDDLTFWYTGEYATEGSSTTRILSFRLSESQYDILPLTVVNPKSSTDLTTEETVTVEIRNRGVNDVNSYNIGYSLDGGPKVETTIGNVLKAGESFTYTFDDKINLNEIKEYSLKVFTTLINDEVLTNDSLITTIIKMPSRDLAAQRIVNLNSQVCGSEKDITLEIKNVGGNEITSATVDYFLNGNLQGTVTYMGNIPPGSEDFVIVSLTDLVAGNYDVEFQIATINSDTDQVIENNNISKNFEVIENTTSVTLELLTDPYAEETSWEIRDPSGNIVFSSNGLLDEEESELLIVSEFCMDPDLCYDFVISDTYGDGLAAQGDPEGSYIILNENGTPLAGILTPEFDEEEINNFCPKEACNLSYDLTTLNPTTDNSENGMILIEVTSGVGPNFQYSINGGNTFQRDNIFENLNVGNYVVIVKDDYGCEISTESIILSISTSNTENINEDASINLHPNPTDGIFNVEISALGMTENTIPVTIYSANGQIIQRTKLTNFSGIYKGMISLYHYTAGTYYLKIMIDGQNHLLKVSKI